MNMNIPFPLIGSTWSRARGPDSATCVGLAHGRDYSNCRASEIKLQKWLAGVLRFAVWLETEQTPFLGQVADLDLMLCTSINQEHAVLFPCLIFTQ